MNVADIQEGRRGPWAHGTRTSLHSNARRSSFSSIAIVRLRRLGLWIVFMPWANTSAFGLLRSSAETFTIGSPNHRSLVSMRQCTLATNIVYLEWNATTHLYQFMPHGQAPPPDAITKATSNSSHRALRWGYQASNTNTNTSTSSTYGGNDNSNSNNNSNINNNNKRANASTAAVTSSSSSFPSFLQVRACWCTDLYHLPMEYCLARFDTCLVSEVGVATSNSKARYGVQCFDTTHAESFVRSFWPIALVWIAALVYAWFCSEAGMSAQRYVHRTMRRKWKRMRMRMDRQRRQRSGVGASRRPVSSSSRTASAALAAATSSHGGAVVDEIVGPPETDIPTMSSPGPNSTMGPGTAASFTGRAAESLQQLEQRLDALDREELLVDLSLLLQTQPERAALMYRQACLRNRRRQWYLQHYAAAAAVTPQSQAHESTISSSRWPWWRRWLTNIGRFEDRTNVMRRAIARPNFIFDPAADPDLCNALGLKLKRYVCIRNNNSSIINSNINNSIIKSKSNDNNMSASTSIAPTLPETALENVRQVVPGAVATNTSWLDLTINDGGARDWLRRNTSTLSLVSLTSIRTRARSEHDDEEPNRPSRTMLVQQVQNRYETASESTRGTTPSCAICLARLRNGDVIGDIPCHHLFHKSCLKDWLLRKNCCPLCQLPGIAMLGYYQERLQQQGADTMPSDNKSDHVADEVPAQ